MQLKLGVLGTMGNETSRARFGPFEVDQPTREQWKFGTPRKLIGQPFEILAVLLAKPGQLVSREELRTRLWSSDTFVDFNHGLNAAVNKLRDALSDSADNPRYIETLPRRGYRFIATVEWINADLPIQNKAVDVNEPDREPPSPVATPAVATAPMSASQRSAPSRGSSRLWITGGAVAAVLLAGSFLFILRPAFHSDASAHALVERTRPLFSISDTNTPAFSPDGNSVAFYRQHSAAASAGIYVNAIGSDRFLQLTDNEYDCCPVWSPDGRWIAFSREHNHEYSIYLVPADGGGEDKLKSEEALGKPPAAFKLASTTTVERKLDTVGVLPLRGEIDWSPDGKSIAFAGPDGLYLVDLNKAGARRLTEVPGRAEDWGPRFSSDGKNVMFVRTSAIGKPEEIFTVPVSGGNATRIFVEPGRIPSPPQWSFDGKSVIFSANRTGHPALWRAPLDSPGSIAQISQAGSPAWDPAVSRRGYRLAFEHLQRSLSIWQMDLSDPKDKRPYLLVSGTSDTDQGPGPQFSPDGKKLAYMSDRSGTMEIWISNRDGSNPFQLTAVGGAGTPRWSPDSKTVVFDTTTNDGSKIISMNVPAGMPQTLTPDNFHSVCPSWSRDGKWIYFGSTRSGKWQVWKVAAGGGTAVQVTQRGGHAALESPDGKFLYYASGPQPEPEIWRMPLTGNPTPEDEKLMPLIRPGTWASWQPVDGGILFVGPSLGHQAVLSFYDVAHDRTSTVAILNKTPFWLGATEDGKTVAFDQPGQEQAQAMMVENFR
jgi:Tol biopolymer transport system component/DNA-binding winged helix-turn-helix (wHTH) protein